MLEKIRPRQVTGSYQYNGRRKELQTSHLDCARVDLYSKILGVVMMLRTHVLARCPYQLSAPVIQRSVCTRSSALNGLARCVVIVGCACEAEVSTGCRAALYWKAGNDDL